MVGNYARRWQFDTSHRYKGVCPETDEGPADMGTVLRDLAFLAISLYLFVVEFFGRRRSRTMPIRIRRRTT